MKENTCKLHQQYPGAWRFNVMLTDKPTLIAMAMISKSDMI